MNLCCRRFSSLVVGGRLLLACLRLNSCKDRLVARQECTWRASAAESFSSSQSRLHRCAWASCHTPAFRGVQMECRSGGDERFFRSSSLCSLFSRAVASLTRALVLLPSSGRRPLQVLPSLPSRPTRRRCCSQIRSESRAVAVTWRYTSGGARHYHSIKVTLWVRALRLRALA